MSDDANRTIVAGVPLTGDDVHRDVKVYARRYSSGAIDLFELTGGTCTNLVQLSPREVGLLTEFLLVGIIERDPHDAQVMTRAALADAGIK